MSLAEFIKIKLVVAIFQPLLNFPRKPLFWRRLKEFHKASLSVDGKICTIYFKNGSVEVSAANRRIFRIITSFTRVRVNPYYDASYFSHAVLPRENLPLVFHENESMIEIRLKDVSDSPTVRLNIKTATLDVMDHGRILHREKRPARTAGNWVQTEKHTDTPEIFLGLGEKSGGLFKNGERYRMWNTDNSAMKKNSDPLYQSCPFAILHNPAGFAHGLFFDNPHHAIFSMSKTGKPARLSYAVKRGPLALYVLTGPTPVDVVKQFSTLTGTYTLPPRWVLGHHHARWEPKESAQRILQIAAEFRKRKIPCDALHIDIAYLNGFRCFTWDTTRFPDPDKFLDDLRDDDFQPVVITDPGLKKDPHWEVYREGLEKGYFLKDQKGNVVHEPVWPGDSAFPDFAYQPVSRWWGKLFKTHTDKAINGFWIDMNEPSTFTPRRTLPGNLVHRDGDSGTPRDHATLHNYYGFMMARATADGLTALKAKKRFFLFTRSAYAGVQRYASSWTGDNRSNWDHLRLAIPMVLNMGLSGQVMTGPDIGGFWGTPTPELFIRFLQAATFFPFHRNHTALDTPPQEVWYFGNQTEEIARKYISLRYSFLPYLYSVLRESTLSGVPVVRPLCFEFPGDPGCLNPLYANNQYMCGSSLLVAPVLERGKNKRSVYFPVARAKGSDPADDWICYWTHHLHQGGEEKKLAAQIDRLPLFVRTGSVIAKAGTIQSTQELFTKRLSIDIYARQGFGGTLYLDDGETTAYRGGKYSLLAIDGAIGKRNITIRIVQREGKLKPPLYRFKEVRLRMARCPGDNIPLSVTVNGHVFRQETLDLTDRWIIIHLSIKDLSL